MKLVVIGATGYVGSAILNEALQRNHDVTAIVRDPEKLTPHPRLHAGSSDVFNERELAEIIKRHQAVISAFNAGWKNPDLYNQQLQGTRAIINGVKKAGLSRLLFVGGSGSLEISPGLQSVDSPSFPEEYKPGALAMRDALRMLEGETALDWTVLSPSADLVPGQRTGRFRMGENELLRDANGESRISLQDFAMAMLDEVEQPHHLRRRFTVGY